MFMAEYPKYNNFFNTRGSYADKIDWKDYAIQRDDTRTQVS
jgi:hypothetical protein